MRAMAQQAQHWLQEAKTKARILAQASSVAFGNLCDADALSVLVDMDTLEDIIERSPRCVKLDEIDRLKLAFKKAHGADREILTLQAMVDGFKPEPKPRYDRPKKKGLAGGGAGAMLDPVEAQKNKIEQRRIIRVGELTRRGYEAEQAQAQAQAEAEYDLYVLASRNGAGAGAGAGAGSGTGTGAGVGSALVESDESGEATSITKSSAMAVDVAAAVSASPKSLSLASTVTAAAAAAAAAGLSAVEAARAALSASASPSASATTIGQIGTDALLNSSSSSSSLAAAAAAAATTFHNSHNPTQGCTSADIELERVSTATFTVWAPGTPIPPERRIVWDDLLPAIRSAYYSLPVKITR